MTIKVGDKLPSVTLTAATAEGPKPLDTAEFFAGKKVVVFAVPGAFTPTCSAKHLPGFLTHSDALKAKGADAILCLSVNDVFVMDAWRKDQKADDKVTLVADGSAVFAKAVGLSLDLTAKGLGVRSDRYAMIVENGVVKWLAVEAPGAFEASTAEAVLAAL